MSARFVSIASATLLFALVTLSAQQGAAPAPAAGRQGGAAPARGVATAPPAIQWSTPPAPTATVALDTGVQHMVWVVPTRGFIQP